MIIKGSTTDILMRRAVDMAVLGLISYFGFLADVKKSITDTQAYVAGIKQQATAAAEKAATCEDRINEHIKTTPKPTS